jgi:DNA-binding IclR family transcriptional regulator
LDLLELLSRESAGLTLSQLSERLSAPKNSIFRITQTLLGRGYLARDEATLAFRITARFLKLASPSLGARSLPEVARQAMIQLRDETGETVQLGVLNGAEGVIIDQVEGTQPLRIVVNLGLRFALHNNAPGKLLLASMPSPQRHEAIKKMGLPASTPRTITNQAALEKECERILQRGYSTDHAEADEGVHCVAAPIIEATGGVAGALWISGPAKRIPKRSFADYGEQVSKAAACVSLQLGECV